MRNGMRIFDADTHVRCAAEAIEPFLDSKTRRLVGDLEPHMVEIKVGQAGEKRQPPYKHYFRFHRGEGWGGSTPRHLGEAEPRANTEREFQQFMGSRFPTEGANEDPLIRLRDMDEEGTDVHLMVPTGPNEHKDPVIEMGFIQANHRFLDNYCSADASRLKSMIVVTARSIEQSVEEIHAWGSKKWSIGVFPHLPLDYPLDHPDLNPIWDAAMEFGLPVVHHSFAAGYPGYRDLWSNPFLGRLSSHPWGAMRAVGAFFAGGVMDRFPGIKFVVLESGFGWLPFWAKRMDDQVDYMGYVAEGLKKKPSEYMLSGQFACSIVLHEGSDMVRMCNELLGDDVLMFGSDYPHAESRFPDSVRIVEKWDNILENSKQKLFWDNAVRIFGEP
jgi:uncharacterized protein